MKNREFRVTSLIKLSTTYKWMNNKKTTKNTSMKMENFKIHSGIKNSLDKVILVKFIE